MRFQTRYMIVAAAILAAPLQAQRSEAPSFSMISADADTSAPILSLTISASETARPDIAFITGGVTTTDPNASAAMSENSRKMTVVISSLRKAGVADKDIQTSGIGLGRVYDWEEDKRVDKGFRASNSITILIRELETAGKILQAMVDSGANNVGGPDFQIEDDSALTLAARKKAISKAAEMANFYAQQTGFRKAELFAIIEGPESGARVRAEQVYGLMEAAADASDEVPVQAGELVKTVTIDVKYRLVK